LFIGVARCPYHFPLADALASSTAANAFRLVTFDFRVIVCYFIPAESDDGKPGARFSYALLVFIRDEG